MSGPVEFPPLPPLPPLPPTAVAPLERSGPVTERVAGSPAVPAPPVPATPIVFAPGAPFVPLVPVTVSEAAPALDGRTAKETSSPATTIPRIVLPLKQPHLWSSISTTGEVTDAECNSTE
jgi:hypothetical protein